ncbi:MAG TPA: 16S rRNA (guanine(527)-N(7))-methyltransferase RsmG [Clostridiales bacterium]|nr:16S rRNA (guanine(527)-N(7))-methyltransferase RsmG [Clostridiales bacterium]
MPADLPGWLPEIGRRLDRPFSLEEIRLFLEYIKLLREWNEKINLTSILDDEGIAVRHLLDSLTLLPYLDASLAAAGQAGIHLIDVGSGAGLPGLALKIVRPDLQVVLLDALAKRVAFLDAAIARLKLRGISARHGRAEDAGRSPDLREQMDVAAARAVASLPALCEYCLPFVRCGGIFLAMKGQISENWSDANRALRLLGGELSEVRNYNLPGTDMKRTVLVIGKVAPTPPAYPRKAGLPERKPLL